MELKKFKEAMRWCDDGLMVSSHKWRRTASLGQRVLSKPVVVVVVELELRCALVSG